MFKRKAAPAYELRELKCFCGAIPIEKGRFFLQGKGGPFHARHMQRPTRKPTLVKYGGGHGSPLDGVDGYVEIPNRGSLAGMMENSVLAGYQDNTLRASAQITRAKTVPLIAKLL